VDGLCVQFPTAAGPVRAVDGVSFSIGRGRTLALIGESGCGKTMTGYALLRLVPPPGRVERGRIVLRPREGPPMEVTAFRDDDDRLYRLRGGVVSMVFQEPMTALSPVHTVGAQIAEALRLHRGLNRRAARQAGIDLLRRVGLAAPEQRYDRYPHEFSGGMRQRAVIAMALASGPELLIADEPTTALDATTQAQILSLLKGVQRDLGCGVLLITHDFGVVAQMADDVAVMYLGRVVEQGRVREVLSHPRHPYTRGLLRSLPGVDAGGRLASIPGTVPSLTAVPRGCAFHPRCIEARAGRCDGGEPPPLRMLAPDHAAACVRAEELEPQPVPPGAAR
jgi:oligopeptide/dipeptide ABC transporter ATP-binding protein